MRLPARPFTRLLACLGVALATWLPGASFAVTFTVNDVTDYAFTAVNLANGVITAGAGVGRVSLRSAIAAANAQAGPHTINLPAGNHTLSVSNGGVGLTPNSLVVGSNVNLDTTIQGADPANPQNTVISMSVAGNDVIETAFNSSTGLADLPMKLTLKNLQVSGGTRGAIYTGASTASTRSVTTIDRCVIKSNSNGSTTYPGGAIINEGGDLIVTNSTISDNTSSNSNFGQGAGLHYTLRNASGAFSVGTLTVQGCTFSNNVAGIGAGYPAGGAIFVGVTANNSLTIDQCTFASNQANGGGDGGAVALSNSTPNLALTRNIFSSNTASTATGKGGAVVVQAGPATFTYNRFVSNSATTAANGRTVRQSAGNTAAVSADLNWWGVNAGPPTNDVVGTNVTASKWLQLRTSASPSSIVTNQSTTVTTSFLTDSSGGAVSASNLSALVGLPVTWSRLGGTLASSQASIQAAGTATTSYSDSSGVAASHTVTAVVDSAPSSGSVNTAAITVQKAATATGITSVPVSTVVYGQPFTVNYVVLSPTGNSPTAPSGSVVLSDGISSATGSAATSSASLTLFTVGTRDVKATYGGDANFTSSVSGGYAIIVNKANTVTSLTSHTPDPSLAGQGVTVQYSVTASAPGSGTPTGSVTISDGVNSVSGTVLAGQATLVLNTTGSRTLTATYAGDTNFNGSTSSGVSHTVNGAPQVTTSPSSQTIYAGATASFTAAASGFPTPSIQWQVSTNGGTSFSDIGGATSATLSFVAQTPDNAKRFRAVFTNSSGTVNSTSALLTVYARPVANPDTISRLDTQTSLRVTAASLLANDTSPQSFPLTISAVGPAASGQASVSLSGSDVLYQAAQGFTGTDSFPYTISDGNGGTATGTVTVTISNSQSATVRTLDIQILGDGTLRVRYKGIPGIRYTVQSTESLAPANWQPRRTATADAAGNFEFIDSTPLPAARFYRATAP